MKMKMMLSLHCRALVGSLALLGASASSKDKPGELECALRHLAFNFSQSLLPDASSAHQHDADVAAALRLGSDCGLAVPTRTAPPPLGARPAGGSTSSNSVASTAGSCTLYVATGGSDSSGTGAIGKPFASLARAQAALPSARSSTAEHCTVYVGAGTYYLPDTLELGPEDSNTAWLAEEGTDVTLSGGTAIPTASFKPSTADPKVLAADVSALNLSTVTPRGSTGGPANRLFVDDAPMTWARFPDAPPHLPECALKIPLGRVGLSMPPRVGYQGNDWQASCGVVANHSWMIPTIGPQPGPRCIYTLT